MLYYNIMHKVFGTLKAFEYLQYIGYVLQELD